jgi:nucleoside permease NupC
MTWDLLLPAALAALVYFRKSPGVVVIALILFANIFSIAMTWGATGRFMVPVQPLLLALVSAMAVGIVRQAGAWLRRARPGDQPA